MANIQNGMSMTLQATGDIEPRRFVIMSTAADYTGEQAGAGEFPIGVSQEFSRDTPQSGASTLAATTGQQVGVYGITKVCLLDVATTVTAGAILKSDGDGKGIPAGAGDKYGAVSLQSGVAGDQIQVTVTVGELET